MSGGVALNVGIAAQVAEACPECGAVTEVPGWPCDACTESLPMGEWITLGGES